MQEYKLDDICLKVQKTNKEKQPGDKRFAYIDIASIDNDRFMIVSPKSYAWSDAPSRAQQIIAKDDIVFATVRPYLKNIALVPQELDGAIASTGFCVIRPNHKLVLPKLLFYYVTTNKLIESLSVAQRGTSYPAVRDKDIMAQRILLPSLNEQEKIVAKIEELFSEIDASVSNLLATRKLLITYKAAILDRAFCQIASEHPESITTIGESYEVYIGSTPSRKEQTYWDGDVNWVSSGEVAFKEIYSTKEKITALGLAKSSTQLHPPGTVMLAMIGEGKTRGQAGILRISAAHNQNTAAIEVDGSRNSSEYLYYYLMSEYDRTRSIGSGNNQKALNKSRVQAMKIPLPNKRAQEGLVFHVSGILSQIEQLSMALEEGFERSRNLKQSILTRAFKGELV